MIGKGGGRGPGWTIVCGSIRRALTSRVTKGAAEMESDTEEQCGGEVEMGTKAGN